MTSRSYTKSYSRKVNTVSPGSIQFDKLFRENTNRPSAAKSAGIVGKWGITSFTSIRSTNINGRREEIQSKYPSKRAKMDYANQNSRVNSVKDPFSFDAEKTEPPISKPKKFFKSRNVVPAIEEETINDSAVFREVTDTQYGRPRPPKQIITKPIIAKSPIVQQKKFQENFNSGTNQTPVKEEGKPPIVLRICKGTARLVCGDLESENESHKINSPLSSPKKVDTENKSSPESELYSDTRTIRSEQQTVVNTIPNPLDPTETRRTTRSRSRNLRDIVSPTTVTPKIPVSSNSHNSGLSLTLRKSVTDSNNTLISHYDIVKTDSNTNYPNKPSVEPLIGKDQPLPTTTQELIDILSSDSISSLRPEASSTESILQSNQEEIEQESISEYREEFVNRVADNNSSNQEPVESESEHEFEYEKRTSEGVKKDPIQQLGDAVGLSTKATVEQDWLSGSEDSDGLIGNVENEVPLVIQDEQIDAIKSLPAKEDVSLSKPITKKGSIFKSRSAGTTNGNKRRALYKHKWSDNDKELSAVDSRKTAGDNSKATSSSHTNPATVAFEGEFESEKLTRIVTYPETDVNFTDSLEAVTSIRCGKNIKGFYTVVKNVKKAHQIQESGEFQEFNDDVEYILDTLRENNPNATRCLSAIRLASKCMAPAFRMHVRAHGTVAKFFKALHDATKDQSLGLCTATVMFVLSQDRLAMDLDRDCLELMLSLLESDASHKDALDDCGLSRSELLKNKEKVRQLCADIQAQGHAKHLNLDNITVGQLAMETLLSLTSRRAGEWFKEELRELGGLEHIVQTIRECYRSISVSEVSNSGWCNLVLDKLRKVDRCLRVLENVTHMNEENQVYLLKYGEGVLVNTLASLYQLCANEIPIYPIMDSSDKSSTGAVIRECLFAIIKVLINLTHRFNRQSFGSRAIGTQPGVLRCTLCLLLRLPESIPEDKRFDIMMLALILLINLVEQCDDNKKLLIEAKAPDEENVLDSGRKSGVEALIHLFYEQEELARLEEQKTDAILDGKKDSEQTETVSTTAKSQEEFIEETVTKLLQKAGRHMEHTLIGAYVVLLLGYLVMDNKTYEKTVRNMLPDHNFGIMIAVLQKFFNFMNLTASNEVSSCGIAATEKVIKFLKMSDVRVEEEEEESELPLPALENSNMMLDMSSS